LGATGHYFPPGSARFSDATLGASDDGKTLTVRALDGAALSEAPRRKIQATSRLGGVKRRLDFPDGGRFETADDDSVDALFRQGSGVLHRLEQSWRVVLVSVLVAAAAAAWCAIYGVPIAAHWLALRTPPRVATYITRQTMDILEGPVLEPTGLKPAERRRFQTLFARVAARQPRGTKAYRLLLRNSPAVGPNAFALPDGTIVLTDQLAAMVAKDAEIEGVFAHEMAHVNRAHTLQQVYQASLVPAIIAFVTGDATQVGHFAAILPGILLQSAYSRQFEQESDDDAARIVRGMGGDPGALGDLLVRMEKTLCGRKGCGPSWLGDHPATAERAARLRGAR
jgi:Zn-dependent protease with chaperone function